MTDHPDTVRLRKAEKCLRHIVDINEARLELGRQGKEQVKAAWLDVFDMANEASITLREIDPAATPPADSRTPQVQEPSDREKGEQLCEALGTAYMKIHDLERRCTAYEVRVAQIGAAARYLVNELKGSMPLCECALREEMGNTNYTCLETRRDELDAALTGAPEVLAVVEIDFCENCHEVNTAIISTVCNECMTESVHEHRAIIIQGNQGGTT